jgi:6-phosphogluconolactonase
MNHHSCVEEVLLGDEDNQNQQSERRDVSLFLASSVSSLESALHRLIIEACQASIDARGVFCIALSGGSVAGFLSTLHQSFQQLNVDPHFDCWHMCLADERLVPSSDADSNLQSIQAVVNRWSSTRGAVQLYGIDEALLGQEDDDRIASSYETSVLRPLLEKSNGTLDCIVLGFGPDGHTCSLFPNHPSISQNREKQQSLVIAVKDSPKPPPRRISLTLPVINASKCIIVCGAGSSKKDVVRQCFQQPVAVTPSNSGITSDVTNDIRKSSSSTLWSGRAQLLDPPPYPCAMVRPSASGVLSWVLDTQAAQNLALSKL